jgi:SAM-dependent methyltransferase
MGFRVTGLDMHKEALNFARRRTNASLVCSTLEKYQSSHLFDAIGAFDVTVHVDNDDDFIRQCGAKLSSDGWLYLSVPAHMSLWSEYDVFSGHKRRYTKESMQSLLKRNGFSVCDIRYFGFFQYIPHIVAKHFIFKDASPKRVDKLSLTRKLLHTPSGMINSILMALNDLELVLSKWVAFPFGTSIIVAARKD